METASKMITARYDNDSLVRVDPTLCLEHLDEANYILFLNKSLAQKLKTIHVVADGYKLDEFGTESFRIDETQFDPSVPVEFSSEELADPWVRIRPSGIESCFTIKFSEWPPRRLFTHRPARNTLPVWRLEEEQEGT
jgi:hypothetical protein